MSDARKVGWLGTGRMGAAMARRLLDSGIDLTVWNRTTSKTAELESAGAAVAESISDLRTSDIVFVMMSTPAVLLEVATGAGGLLDGSDHPGIIVDSSTVDPGTSAQVREIAQSKGVEFLASPISGNPRVVAAGESVLVSSGPRETFDKVEDLLRTISREAVYAGEGEGSRLVKICHNLYLGIIVQALSEVVTVAEKSGVPRAAFMDFINNTVLGSDWVRERTPDLLALDWSPTFTLELLRKDFDLGLAAAREAEVPMPLSSGVLQLIQNAIGRGYRDQDFLSMFEVQAASAGMAVEPQ
ncbi:MAG: NAD-binding protein [Acidimicrobiia bacterium]|nr:NAD-binding protein [Acidimicrobiia bacterium]